jgi:hypothetical protein
VPADTQKQKKALGQRFPGLPDEVLIGRIANGDRLAMQVLYAATRDCDGGNCAAAPPPLDGE